MALDHQGTDAYACRYYQTGHSRYSWQKKLDEIPKDNYFSSDTSKIEHSFYAIFALTRQERECLEQKLEELRKQGLIFWGMHVSNRAMLTCLIQLDIGQEVHFVDAADGGYAMASRQLKQQLIDAD
ncbi:MAG: hypothetical protein CMR00_08510 [[Chlorobium] sp. 445]|nr:MAG: hypothetical protein CMR00_08510 [[Chlorobium] sp. 445]